MRMKKSIKRFLSACAVMTALTAVSALSVSAAGDVTAKEDTGKTAIDITLSDAAKNELKGQVTVLVFKGDSTVAAPTEDQIVYLDQKAQADGDFVFAKVLPYLGETTTPMADGDTYTVRISKTGGVTEKGFYEATFKVGEEAPVNIEYGNVNGDHNVSGDPIINSADAVMILDSYVENIVLNDDQKKVANVYVDYTATGDPIINSADASTVLDYYVENITKLPVYPTK